MSDELTISLRVRALLDEARAQFIQFRSEVAGATKDLGTLAKTGDQAGAKLSSSGAKAAEAIATVKAPPAPPSPAPPPPVPATLPAPTPIAPKVDEDAAAMRRLIATLQSAAPAAEKFAAAQGTLNAALASGAITQERHATLLAAATARWGAHNDVVQRGGVSAAQTAAAMRMLPAQITDITTSLASGMPAWLVLIQQGGQIKDSFGGIGPAFKQIAGLFTLARVAAVGLAGAVAAVTVAAYKGSQETPAYNQALIMSGNAAGTTGDKLAGMAKRIGDVVGTQAAAAETLTTIAGSGRVAAGDIERFTLAAQQMERAGGQSADKTAAAFIELGKAPLQASLKLTESLNYLTPATRDHIKSLEEQGKMAEAAAVAQQAYFEMVNGRTPQLEANLGGLQRMWRAVGEAAGWAWDKMLSIGRQDTLDAQIEAQKKTVDRLAQTLADRRGRGLAVGDVEGPLGAAREHLRNLQEDKDEQASLARTQGELAKVRREYNEAEKANDRWADKALSKSEQVNKALTTYRENNKKINAGRISDGMAPLDAKTVAAQEAAIRKEIMSKGGSGGAPSAFRTASAEVAVTKAELQANFTALQTNIRAGDAIIVQALQDGQVSIGDAYDARLAQMRTESDAQRQVLQADLREIDAALAKAKNSAESGPLRQRRVEVAAQINLVDANLSEQARKLGIWKTEQERTLGSITAKVRIDVANLTGNFDREAVQAQLKAQLQGDYDAAGRAGSEAEQAAGRARVDMLVAAGTAQAEFNAKLAEAQRLQNALAVQEQAVQVQQQTGAISAIEAEGRIAAARERQAPALQAIVEQLHAMRDAMPADAAAAIDAMNVSIGQLQNTVNAATPSMVSFGTQTRSTIIDGVANAAGQAVTNFKNLREAAKTAMKQIAGDILTSGIKRLLTNEFKPDASAGAKSSSGSSSSLFGALGTLFGSFFGFSEGGHIKGPGTGTSDSIPALVDGRRPIAVSNNEFIQPDKAVRHYGVGFMEAVRTLRLPKPGFAFGGLVQAHQRARFATGGPVGGGAAPMAPGPVPVAVSLTNNGTPQRIADNSATWNGKEMLVNLMLEDAQSGGPITRGMQQAFNRGG